MKRRQKIQKIDAIICSDLHLTEQTPECRLDNYIEAQRTKLSFISGLQKQYKCPVLCAGDIFDHWKPSPWLISFALQYLPDELIAIPGQHDLPQHNLDLIEKSGFGTLLQGNKVKTDFWNSRSLRLNGYEIYTVPFGIGIPKPKYQNNNILIIHQLTWQKEPWPGADPKGNASVLLKQNPDFDLIITGDNHQAFTEEREGRLLINPGSMLRKTADQIDFKPRVYLWDAESNTAEPVYLPIEAGVVSRKHIEIKEERKNRLDAFINIIKSEEFEIGVSFEETVRKVLNSRNITQTIKAKVLEALDA